MTAGVKSRINRCAFVREIITVRSVIEAEEHKGTWWMPRLSQAMKDVTSCDKPRVGANGR